MKAHLRITIATLLANGRGSQDDPPLRGKLLRGGHRLGKVGGAKSPTPATAAAVHDAVCVGGTVESAIQHTQSTVLKGRKFDSIEEQNAWLAHWEERWAATGKRHIATAIALGALDHGYRVFYREAHVLIEEIHEARQLGELAAYREQIAAAHLVVIDDLMAARG